MSCIYATYKQHMFCICVTIYETYNIHLCDLYEWYEALTYIQLIIWVIWGSYMANMSNIYSTSKQHMFCKYVSIYENVV